MTDERIAEIERHANAITRDPYSGYPGDLISTQVPELIAALREARQDTRRLDWLESTEGYMDCTPDDPFPWRCETGERYHVPIDVWGMNPRAAIDAAIAAEEVK